MAVNALHVRVCAGLHSCCLLTFEYLKKQNTNFILLRLLTCDVCIDKFKVLSTCCLVLKQQWMLLGCIWIDGVKVGDIGHLRQQWSIGGCLLVNHWVCFVSSGPLGTFRLVLCFGLWRFVKYAFSIKNPQLSAACLTWSWTRKMSVWLSADTMLLVLVVLQTQGFWYYSTMQ